MNLSDTDPRWAAEPIRVHAIEHPAIGTSVSGHSAETNSQPERATR